MWDALAGSYLVGTQEGVLSLSLGDPSVVPQARQLLGSEESGTWSHVSLQL